MHLASFNKNSSIYTHIKHIYIYKSVQVVPTKNGNIYVGKCTLTSYILRLIHFFLSLAPKATRDMRARTMRALGVNWQKTQKGHENWKDDDLEGEGRGKSKNWVEFQK